MKQKNIARADRARRTLAAYAALRNEAPSDDDLTDLLVDLHHHLRASGDENPAAALADRLRLANDHFSFEETSSG